MKGVVFEIAAGVGVEERSGMHFVASKQKDS